MCTKPAQNCLDPINLTLAPVCVDMDDPATGLPLEEIEGRHNTQTATGLMTTLEVNRDFYFPGRNTLSLRELVPPEVVDVKLHVDRDLPDSLWNPST